MIPDRVWLYGEDRPLPERRPLRAGPLALELERGELLSLRLGGVEILRRVYVAVRDRNWGTIAPEISAFREDVREDRFEVAFHVENREGAIHFAWDARITGAPDGTVTFAMDGAARTTFLRNRIGFCVLHPDSAAGARCRIQHADGTRTEGALPAAIAPHQPFKELRTFAHEAAPGVWAELAFEGDIFEMEDQRNWTDASFKTYCTPLRLPFPAEIAAGTRVAQTITLRLQGVSPARARAAEVGGAPTLDLRAGPDLPVPPIGLGVASHGQPLGARERALLELLRPGHLRVDLKLADASFAAALRRADEEAVALGAGLELALFAPREAPEAGLAALAAMLPQLGARVARALVFRQGQLATRPEDLALVRTALGPALPGVPLAVGTDAYFTELNRGPRPDFGDAVTFSVNPQIHAFDVGSMVETLDLHALTVENARRLAGGRPVVVSPVTLRPRYNVVATAPPPPPAPGELPDQVDPRQASLFAAAWTLGSVAALTSARAASVTYYETSGWRGVVETPAGSPLPARFAALPGCAFPLFHPLADVAELRGGPARVARSSRRFSLAGITFGAGGRATSLVANLAPADVEVALAGAPGGGAVRRLDLGSVARACQDPEAFRAARGERLAAGAPLALGPFAVVRIDWEVAP